NQGEVKRILRLHGPCAQLLVMNRAPSDRNLVFGILAVQLNYIGRDALINAMSAWVLAKYRPLGDILVEQGALSTDKRDTLETIVEKHLHKHVGYVRRSLAAVVMPGALRESLQHCLSARTNMTRR